MTVPSSRRASTGWTTPNVRMERVRASSSSPPMRRGLAGSGWSASMGTDSMVGVIGSSGGSVSWAALGLDAGEACRWGLLVPYPPEPFLGRLTDTEALLDAAPAGGLHLQEAIDGVLLPVAGIGRISQVVEAAGA